MARHVLSETGGLVGWKGVAVLEKGTIGASVHGTRDLCPAVLVGVFSVYTIFSGWMDDVYSLFVGEGDGCSRCSISHTHIYSCRVIKSWGVGV